MTGSRIASGAFVLVIAATAGAAADRVPVKKRPAPAKVAPVAPVAPAKPVEPVAPVAPVAPATPAEPAATAPAAPPEAASTATPVPPLKDTNHKGQFEVSLRLGLGLRAIVPYSDKNYCGATDSTTSTGNAPVCTGRAPFSMDLEAGFGVTRRIDLIAELRVGLESDFGATAGSMSGPRMFFLSPGARFFFSDSKSSKLFTTAQLVFDFAGYKDAGGSGRGADLGVRNLNGLWFDLNRSVGVYGFVGETATAARWLRFELELGLGVQARYR